MTNVAYLSSLMNSRISCSSLSSIIRSLLGQRGWGVEREGDQGSRSEISLLTRNKHLNDYFRIPVFFLSLIGFIIMLCRC